MVNYLFELSQRYSFDLYGGGVLPHKANNVKIVSVLSGTTAERLGYNVSTKHAQVFAILPPSPATTDFTSQMYYEVEYDSGERDCFGEYWINQETIRKETRSNIEITLMDVDPTEVEGIREILSAHGFKIASITKHTARIVD